MTMLAESALPPLSPWLRTLFFVGVVRPVMMVVLGLNVRNRQGLPCDGPAIIVANHNSHLDTLALMALFPVKLLPKLRPVAAADYFLRTGWLAWFALRIIGIVPLMREVRGKADPLELAERALDEGAILILFPEGSRGEPEKLSAFKSGIHHLARRRPEVPVIPVLLHGFGKALPRGEAILVPFFCDVFVRVPVAYSDDKRGYMAALEAAFRRSDDDGPEVPFE